MTELPPAVPTKAVIDTLDHILAHGHSMADGQTLSQRDHFIAVLREEVGLEERKPAEAKGVAP